MQMSNSNPTSEQQVRHATQIIDTAIAQHEPAHIFLAYSGGSDSIAAAHLASKHLRRPFKVLHLNTGIGIAETRRHVDRVCKQYDWELIQIRAKEDCGQDYEQLVLGQGFPGPPQHKKMFNRLKERCLEELARRYDGRRLLLISGMRTQESRRRMLLKPEPIQQYNRRVWCAPLFYWSNDEVDKYLEEHELPRNPVSENLCMSGECLCGAFAEPGDLWEIEFFYPEDGKRLRELQNRVIAAGYPWGWDERPPAWWVAMKAARKGGQQDAFEEELSGEISIACAACQRRAEARAGTSSLSRPTHSTTLRTTYRSF